MYQNIEFKDMFKCRNHGAGDRCLWKLKECKYDWVCSAPHNKCHICINKNTDVCKRCMKNCCIANSML